MTRLFKCTALLMSLLLFILTLCGLLGRSEGGGARAVLIQEYTQNSRYSQLRWVVPGTSINRPIASPFISTFRIEYQSPDRRYQYWSGAAVGGLYRIDLTTGKQQRVTNLVYATAYFSPDDEWLIFDLEDNSEMRLYRTRVNGHDGLPLTDGVRFSESVSPYHFPAQISSDSQWVYFTDELVTDHLQIFRISIAGGPIEPITSAETSTRMEFWPAESAWPIVRRDNRLYWMRPDGGEFQPVLDVPETLTIVGWLPDEQLLIVQGERLYAVRLGDASPLWQINGPYRGFFMLDGWLVLYGGAVARMRPDGTHYMELAGQTASDTATLMGVSLKEPALIIFRDFPGTGGRNRQLARLADGHIQALPVPSSLPPADLLADLDWESPYIRQVMDILTTTNLQPHRSQFMQDDFVALGPPIDRKLSPIPLMLMAGGLLVFGLAPRRRIFRQQ